VTLPSRIKGYLVAVAIAAALLGCRLPPPSSAAALPYMDRQDWTARCDSLWAGDTAFRLCARAYPVTAWPWATP
jgi:hypothetical protein